MKKMVALYPGTVYQAGDPLFLASLCNHYVLRTFDGMYVDGKSNGLSRSIFNSLVLKHAQGACLSDVADVGWIHGQSPLAVGQIVNNGNAVFQPNVRYQELNLPPDLPSHFRQFIPNIHYHQNWDPFQDFTRVVVLISNRAISNEELFSTYHEFVD
jgi:hypothetical protein